MHPSLASVGKWKVEIRKQKREKEKNEKKKKRGAAAAGLQKKKNGSNGAFDKKKKTIIIIMREALFSLPRFSQLPVTYVHTNQKKLQEKKKKKTGTQTQTTISMNAPDTRNSEHVTFSYPILLLFFFSFLSLCNNEHDRTHTGTYEIGRASCRERV